MPASPLNTSPAKTSKPGSPVAIQLFTPATTSLKRSHPPYCVTMSSKAAVSLSTCPAAVMTSTVVLFTRKGIEFEELLVANCKTYNTAAITTLPMTWNYLVTPLISNQPRRR